MPATTRHDVIRTETPQATKTWQPIPHAYMLEQVESRLSTIGMQVEKENHVLDHRGARWFATLQIKASASIIHASNDQVREALGTDLRDAHPDQVREAIVAAGTIEEKRKYALVVGVRNAHDKAFRAGLACGSRVFVCSNLDFSGEVVVGRKHTSMILRDLPNLIEEAIGKVIMMEKVQTERLELYQATSMSDFALHDTVIKAVDRGVIPTSKIPAVLGLWRGNYKSRTAEGEEDPVAWGEAHEAEFTNSTVWRAFNAFTSVLKVSNLFDLPRKTRTLHDLCDGLCGYEVHSSTLVNVG